MYELYFFLSPREETCGTPQGGLPRREEVYQMVAVAITQNIVIQHAMSEALDCLELDPLSGASKWR